MPTAHFQSHRLVLQPITPIHIGSGVAVEPYEYVLRREGDATLLYGLNLASMLPSLTAEQRQQFQRLLQRDDFVALRRWLHQTADVQRHSTFSVSVGQDAFREISANIDNPARLGEIHLFQRDPRSGNCYLPGSSLKGAIRTAVVDAHARGRLLASDVPDRRVPQLAQLASQMARNRHGGAMFEAHVMGNISNDQPDLYTDPLRQLAISDLPMPDDSTYIDRVQIVQAQQHAPGRSRRGPARRQKSDTGDILIYREVTGSLLLDDQQTFSGELRLFPYLADKQRMGRVHPDRPNWLPFELRLETLLRACNDFYLPRLEDEVRRYRRQICEPDQLLKEGRTLAANQCLVRLGRHSHMECVTLGQRFRQAGRWGTSRTYVQGTLPLGWARLTIGE